MTRSDMAVQPYISKSSIFEANVSRHVATFAFACEAKYLMFTSRHLHLIYQPDLTTFKLGISNENDREVRLGVSSGPALFR